MASTSLGPFVGTVSSNKLDQERVGSHGTDARSPSERRQVVRFDLSGLLACNQEVRGSIPLMRRAFATMPREGSAMSRDVGLLALSVIFIGSIPRANTPLHANPKSLIVQTASGSVRGQLVQDVYSFKGIPFASPPVGALRWRAPAPVDAWSGVRDASRYGPPCAQPAFDWN